MNPSELVKGCGKEFNLEYYLLVRCGKLCIDGKTIFYCPECKRAMEQALFMIKHPYIGIDFYDDIGEKRDVKILEKALNIHSPLSRDGIKEQDNLETSDYQADRPINNQGVKDE